MCRTTVDGTRKGFTLVELAVVIVIIGVLAAFGVPKFLKSVERSKAAEAFQYLAAVRAAQERYISKEGQYAKKLVADAGSAAVGVEGEEGYTPAVAASAGLDITQATPKYFTVPTECTTGDVGEDDNGTPTWSLTLTRIAGSSSYGAYTVTFNQNGYDAAHSTITADECEGINPMGN